MRPVLSLSLCALACGCSDWIMNDAYGLSVRTMDLGTGPTFALKTMPRGHTPLLVGVPAAKLGHIISIGANMTDFEPKGPADDMAFAGLNEAGLSCDLHALLNSSYPPFTPAAGNKSLNLYFFCNYALGKFDSAAGLKAALEAGDVVLWGPPGMGAGGVHFIVRDKSGAGLAVEFIDGKTQLYDDANDGENTFGVFTNEPPWPWQNANVRHYRWKQSLARPATAMPGSWYPDERFLRIYPTKSGMPTPTTYQQAVQHALHVLNTITVPMGHQMGTDSGFGEGAADHTHYAHVYDHKQAVLYWRHESNLQLQRVRLADVLGSTTPLTLQMFNSLPFFHDAAHEFGKP